MVDLKILKACGCTPERWRTLLEKPSREIADSQVYGTNDDLLSDKTGQEKRARLLQRIKSRVNAGRDYNLQNWTQYHLLDLLWATPDRQITPTLVALLAKDFKSTEEADKTLRAYGINVHELIVDETDPKNPSLPIKKLNVPVFTSIMVPLVRAYLTIRRAKLINDRNQTPHIQYKAAANVDELRVKSEILTDRVQVGFNAFNYLETWNQAVLQMLLYRWCAIFPREEWYSEEHVRYSDGESKASSSIDQFEELMAMPKEDREKFEVFVAMEGLRYHTPHPAHCYFDQSYPLKTLNTGTGASWAGYWKVMRYGELLQTKGYYNLDHINIGPTDWWAASTFFFNSVMNLCAMRFPTFTPPEGVDRNDWLASNGYYNQAHEDNAVVTYEHFERHIPSEDGLGSYPFPIWSRFVIAGDGTLIYAAPLGYRAITIFEDNGNSNKLTDSSLAMQLAPFQDAVTNLITQYLMSVKMNLTNLTLVDERVISKDMVDRVKNIGEKIWRRLNLFTFDSKRTIVGNKDISSAIFSHSFQKFDTNMQLQAIRTVLDLAERILQFSSQEVAQAATHEQTVPEIQLIANTTSNILAYTAMPVDEGIAAMGNQQYEAIMNWGEDDFFASIPSDIDLSKKKLEEMGITMVMKSVKPGDRHYVRAKKSAMSLDRFAIVPHLHERQVDAKAAQAIATFMRDILSVPQLQAAIGTDQAIAMANAIAKLAGVQLPEPLHNTGEEPEQEREEAVKLLEQVIAQVRVEMKEGLQPVLEATKVNEIKIDQLYQQLGIPEPNVTGREDGGNGAAPVANPELVATT